MAEKTAEQALNELDSMRSIADLSEIPETLKIYENLTIRCFEQWRTRKLSATEENYLELVSQLELQCVNHYLDAFKRSKGTQNIDVLSNLFRTKIVKSFEENLDYIQDETNDRFSSKSYRSFMNMIDARSLGCRLYGKSMLNRSHKLTSEFVKLLQHKKTEDCLSDVNLIDMRNYHSMSRDHHRFFLGCTTLAIGSLKNDASLLAKGEYDKYIYRVCKYIRIVLAEDDFYRKPNQVYILRGLFVLLANCIEASSWIDIVNQAFSGDRDKQRDNPFNIDFFQKIFDKLLGCVEIQNKTLESAVTEESLLVDAVLIFLHIWFYVGDKSGDETDDSVGRTETSGFVTTRVAEDNVNNEITKYFRADQNDERRNRRAEIVYFYINSKVKCHRTRLMSFSILFKIADDDFFPVEHKKNPNFGKELIDIIFKFMGEAAADPSDWTYNGISFPLHFKFLFHFSVQDFIKQEVMRYINELIDYAQRGHYHTHVLRIISRLCSNVKICKELSAKSEFENFLKHIKTEIMKFYRRVEDLYNQIMVNMSMENVESQTDIKQLMAPTMSKQQAFISYCHEDKSVQERVIAWLRNENGITLWVDTENMQGDTVSAMTEGIRQSTVFICLMSQHYVQSDPCRKEFNFAIAKRKPFFCMILERGFKINRIDWVQFQMENMLYYHFYKKHSKENMITHIQKYLLEPVENNTSSSGNVRPTRHADLNKPIDNWSYDEVAEWCEKHELQEWINHLKNYDGPSLLILNSSLNSEGLVMKLCDKTDLNPLHVWRFQAILRETIALAKKT